MSKVLEFNAKNVKSFTTWLKKFALVNNSVLLEVDKNNREFIAKIHNDERSVVKFSRISFEDAGLGVITKDPIPQRIKVGIYHIPRLIKSIDQFSSGEFTIGFKYDELIGENSELVGIGILLKNSSLKMIVDCTSLHIFKYLSDDQFLNKIAKVIPLVTFDLTGSMIEKINSLSDLDNEYKFVDFRIKSQKVVVRGKSFENILSDCDNLVDAGISIYKNQFDKVDVENYSVDLSEDRIIYKSKDSDTITVTSMVEKDEKYDETTTDF
jgi:hypothetical protein